MRTAVNCQLLRRLHKVCVELTRGSGADRNENTYLLACALVSWTERPQTGGGGGAQCTVGSVYRGHGQETAVACVASTTQHYNREERSLNCHGPQNLVTQCDWNCCKGVLCEA